MIAQLTGSVLRTDPNSVVVDVHGVGYRAFVPLSVLSSLPAAGGKVSLFTTMIVREDDITLYGFRTQEEQDVFQALIGVAGVGPKVALSLLSVFEGPTLAQAIASGDTKALTRVPGVGPKLAQRIALELGDHMARLAFDRKVEGVAGATPTPGGQAFDDVVEMLVSLQYNRTDARKAAERALTEAGGDADVPDLIRKALSILSGPR